MTRVLAVAALLLSSGGCALIGPACLARQERGAVATLSGSVAAGEVVMHLLSYDTRGSQNDVRIEWPGQRDAGAPRLQAFATLTSCEAFTLPAEGNTGACAIIARGGWVAEGAVSGLILTHGRGNPERLGTPPAYKLWITSDRSTGYGLSVSYFYGPDC
jgi:hypothetical protein